MIVRFGPYALDVPRRELRKAGEPVPIEPLILDLLRHLVEHRDRVVEKEELVEAVWDGRHIGDSAITRAVGELRRALDDSAAESRWIRTVYGRGVRFVGEVDTVEEETPAAGETSVEAWRGPPALGQLPQPSSPIVGREEETIRLLELLTDHRLVTVTGPGDTGKTRLAVEVAGQLRERLAGRVAFVALADVVSAAAVVPAIATAIGLEELGDRPPMEAVSRRLGEVPALLVLDNLEHVLDAAGDVATLVARCPGLVVLATSRSPLRLSGEREMPLAPLPAPSPGAPEEELAGNPAVRLFLERAGARGPEDLGYVAAICRRLDGIPLALELAAARTRIFTPRELWQRLAERLDLLSSPDRDRPERHQTLEGAFRWSESLLAPADRRAFARLAVFVGGFPLGAAAAVLECDEEEALARVESLLEQSLLTRTTTPEGQSRMRILEPLRAFGLERLAREGGEAVCREAHARWALARAEAAAPEIGGPRQRAVLRDLDREHGNLDAALAWCGAAGRPDLGLALCAALRRYWSVRVRYREGLETTAAFLLHPAAESVDRSVRCRGLIAHGLLALLLSDHPTAERSLRESLALADGIPEIEQTELRNHLAWVLIHRRDSPGEGEEMARRTLQRCLEQGDARGEAVALNNLAWAALYRDEPAEAVEFGGRSLERRRAAGDRRGEAFALVNLCVFELFVDGEPGPAMERLERAARLAGEIEDRGVGLWVRLLQAAWQRRRGDGTAARRSIAAMMDEYRQVGGDGLGWALYFLALAEHQDGRTEAARHHLAEARELWARAGPPWLLRLADAAL